MNEELLLRREEPFRDTAPRVTGSGAMGPEVTSYGASHPGYVSGSPDAINDNDDYIETTAANPAIDSKTSPVSTVSNYEGPLFTESELREFRMRWDSVQASFVDEPRQAVAHADVLVKSIVQQITDVFTEERGQLEGQWSRGADISTEDLRQAFKRYRAFFGRLLAF
jgi:hypothetical protein